MEVVEEARLSLMRRHACRCSSPQVVMEATGRIGKRQGLQVSTPREVAMRVGSRIEALAVVGLLPMGQIVVKPMVAALS